MWRVMSKCLRSWKTAKMKAPRRKTLTTIMKKHNRCLWSKIRPQSSCTRPISPKKLETPSITINSICCYSPACSWHSSSALPYISTNNSKGCNPSKATTSSPKPWAKSSRATWICLPMTGWKWSLWTKIWICHYFSRLLTILSPRSKTTSMRLRCWITTLGRSPTSSSMRTFASQSSEQPSATNIETELLQ